MKPDSLRNLLYSGVYERANKPTTQGLLKALTDTFERYLNAPKYESLINKVVKGYQEKDPIQAHGAVRELKRYLKKTGGEHMSEKVADLKHQPFAKLLKEVKPSATKPKSDLFRKAIIAAVGGGLGGGTGYHLGKKKS